jgi:hypothetical protein
MSLRSSVGRSSSIRLFTFHRISDGPIDIHYVDAAGNEIAVDKALAAFGERPAAAVAQK